MIPWREDRYIPAVTLRELKKGERLKHGVNVIILDLWLAKWHASKDIHFILPGHSLTLCRCPIVGGPECC
jgi:hypothetical protein